MSAGCCDVAEGVLVIREAGPSDVDALVELTLQVQRLHLANEPERFVMPSRTALAAWWLERLSDPAWCALVAEIDGACAGYVLFELHRIERPATVLTAGQQALYLHHIGVDESVRHRGIGRALLQAVEQAAADHGAQQVALDTWSCNTTAQAFFTACGYEPYRLRMRRRLPPRRDVEGACA